MFKPHALALAGWMALAAGSAQAVWIVDTGSGPSGVGGWSLFDGSSTEYQHLAASFDVASDTVIDRVAGWIGGSNGQGRVEIQLFAGPGPAGTPVYATSVAGLSYDDAWAGVGGLGWAVAAGSYTVAFVARDGFNGWMSDPVPNPLPPQAYWFDNAVNGGWLPGGPLNFGVQVSAVPEPGTYGLMALGALAVAGAARRQRRTAGA